MRALAALALLMLSAPAAHAQAPKISIEDDVSHESAVKCLALRTAQTQAATPATRAKAAVAAWQAYAKSQPGYSAPKLKAEVDATMGPWTSSANPAQAMAATEKDCLPFEIEALR